MFCPKCGSRMNMEDAIVRGERCLSWHCWKCGKYLDPVIEENFQKSFPVRGEVQPCI